MPEAPRPSSPTDRRNLLRLLGVAPAVSGVEAVAGPAPPSGPRSAEEAADRAAWSWFRTRFMLPEGRLVDNRNGGVSHTEAQGWGLLMAARGDDRASFERILAWTRQNLARRGDALHAWRYRPQAANAVDDQNNATDGDLCIAWALQEAALRWGVADHGAQAVAIARDVLRLLVRRVGDQTVLLPGARGFEQRHQVVINPSYYVFPALRVLARIAPDPAWVRLAADGLGLLRRAQFGRWQLPPDWLAVARDGQALSLPDGYASRFSFDAVRVPLYLAWARLTAEPAVMRAAAFWSDRRHGFLPAWAELTSNAIAPYPASAGVAAIAQLVGARPTGADRPRAAAPEEAGADYYSAALLILSGFARRDLAGVPG